MKKALSALGLVSISTLFLPSAARAAEGGFLDVSTEACPGLRSDEVDRILRIELASLASGWQGAPLSVVLSCEGSRVKVVADDPLTQKRLERTLDLGSVPRDRDRTVALVVSQLFLTSWAELLIEDRKQALAPVAPLPPPPPPVTRAAVTMTRDAVAPRTWSLAIAALGGARVRALDAPVITGRASARPTLQLGDHAHVFGDFSYERGATSRPLGDVSLSLASASLGVGWISSRRATFAFQASLLGGAAYADASGAPGAGSNASGASDSGAVAQIGLALGPTASLGVMRIGIELEGGLAFPRAIARVTRGDDVTLSGPWAGASLVLAAEDPR